MAKKKGKKSLRKKIKKNLNESLVKDNMKMIKDIRKMGRSDMKKGFVNMLTISNVIFGVASIYSSIMGNLQLAVTFIVIAAIMDFMDGRAARRLKVSTEIGKELDSLADVVSFGVAPAVLGFIQFQSAFMIFSTLIFVGCGVARLAKFNVQDVKGVFFGMPITTNAIIFPVCFLLGLDIAIWPVVYLISGLLMISRTKIKKI